MQPLTCPVCSHKSLHSDLQGSHICDNCETVITDTAVTTYLTLSTVYPTTPGAVQITREIREEFFDKVGMFETDENIKIWWDNQCT